MKYSSPPRKESPSGKNYAVSVSNKPSLSGIIIKPPSLNLVSCFIFTFFPTNRCCRQFMQGLITPGHDSAEFELFADKCNRLRRE